MTTAHGFRRTRRGSYVGEMSGRTVYMTKCSDGLYVWSPKANKGRMARGFATGLATARELFEKGGQEPCVNSA